MSNNYNLAVDLAPVLAAVATVDTVVDANALILADIHDTDLPAVQTVVNATGAIALDIHDTDLPAVQTVVNAIRATDITTITNAISAINLRGQYKKAFLSQGTLTFQDVVNLSGQGMLYVVFVQALVNNGVIKVTIDGLATDDLTIVANDTNCLSYVDPPARENKLQLAGIAGTQILNLEYKTSLRVQIKTTNVAGTILCVLYYGEK